MNKAGVLGNVLEGMGEEFKESGKTVLEQVGVAQKKQANPPLQDQSNKDFLKDLYGNAPPVSQDEIKQKELEDKQKSEALAQRLHSEYYSALVNRPKAQEERPAEKVEREKKEDEWELQIKEEKKPKLPRSAMGQQGTAELPKAVSG